MKNKYPRNITKLVEHFFNNTVKPSILPDPSRWTIDEAIKKLFVNCELQIIHDATLSANSSFNENKYIIQFSYGQILSIYEMILISYRYGVFDKMMNEKHETISFKFRRHLLENDIFLMDYSYLFKYPSDNHSFENYFSVDFDETNDDSFQLSLLLTDYALAFISLHERAHIVRGHLEYIKDENKINQLFNTNNIDIELFKKQQKFKPTDLKLTFSHQQIIRQTIEMDADYWAFVELIARNTQDSYKDVYNYPFIKDKTDIIFLTCFSIALVFLLYMRYNIRQNYVDPYTPSPSIRLYQILQLVSESNLTDKEKERGRKAIFTALIMSDNLHSAHGDKVFNSSHIFRFHGDNTELIWGENAVLYYKMLIELCLTIKEKCKSYENKWNNENG